MAKSVMMDIDGVLCNYIFGISAIVRELYEIELPDHPRDIPSWYHCSETIGKERWSVVWDIVTRNSNFLMSLPPLATPGEFAAIQAMHDVNDVYFVTNRSAFGSKAITHDWLVAHGITNPTVILSAEKGMIAKGLGAHFVIEDSTENIRDIRLRSPQTQIYLMLYPYNTDAITIADKWVTSIGEFTADVLAS